MKAAAAAAGAGRDMTSMVTTLAILSACPGWVEVLAGPVAAAPVAAAIYDQGTAGFFWE